MGGSLTYPARGGVGPRQQNLPAPQAANLTPRLKKSHSTLTKRGSAPTFNAAQMLGVRLSRTLSGGNSMTTFTKNTRETPVFEVFLLQALCHWQLSPPALAFVVLALVDALLFGQAEMTRGLWVVLCLLGGQLVLVSRGIAAPLRQLLGGAGRAGSVMAAATLLLALAVEANLLVQVTHNAGVAFPGRNNLPPYTLQEWWNTTAILLLQLSPVLCRVAVRWSVGWARRQVVTLRFTRYVGRQPVPWQPVLVPA
jgi:hypothetical protein